MIVAQRDDQSPDDQQQYPEDNRSLAALPDPTAAAEQHGLSTHATKGACIRSVRTYRAASDIQDAAVRLRARATDRHLCTGRLFRVRQVQISMLGHTLDHVGKARAADTFLAG
jgi:hypothetical protein